MTEYIRLTLYGLLGLFLGMVLALPARAQIATWTCSTGGQSFSTFEAGNAGDFQSACAGTSGTLNQDGGNYLLQFSGTRTGPGQCTLQLTSCVTTGAIACNPLGSAVAMIPCGATYSCPPGQSLISGTCVAASTNGCTVGATVSGSVPVTSASMSVANVQHNGCAYELRDATNCLVAGVLSRCGTWVATGEDVTSGTSKPVIQTGALTPKPPITGTTPIDGTGPGAGVGGGGTSNGSTGFNTADAANLNHVATNTAAAVTATDSVRSAVESANSIQVAAIENMADRLDARLTEIKDKLSEGPTPVAINGNFNDCAVAPVCTGDAERCANALNARATACATAPRSLANVPSAASQEAALSTAAGASPGATFGLTGTTIDTSTIFNTPRWLGAGSCPVVPDFAVMGHAFSVSLTPLCAYSNMIAFILIATATMVAFRIIGSG